MSKEHLRPCEVTAVVGKKETIHQGWFHCWEHHSEVVGESPLRGGHAAGQISCVFGIVESEHGQVARFHPQQIRFTDR